MNNLFYQIKQNNHPFVHIMFVLNHFFQVHKKRLLHQSFNHLFILSFSHFLQKYSPVNKSHCYLDCNIVYKQKHSYSCKKRNNFKSSAKPECRKGIMLVPGFRKRLLSVCVFVRCTPRLRHSAAILSIQNVCFHSEHFGTLFLGPSSFHTGISCSIKFKNSFPTSTQ